MPRDTEPKLRVGAVEKLSDFSYPPHFVPIDGSPKPLGVKGLIKTDTGSSLTFRIKDVAGSQMNTGDKVLSLV